MTRVGVQFGESRQSRRPGLTPLIDVVFLLLVFFMLATRFGVEVTTSVVPAAGGSADWVGPPRLVSIAGAEQITLNGAAISERGLVDALRPLMPSPDAPVILRAEPGATLQDVMTIAGIVREGGFSNLVFAR